MEDENNKIQDAEIIHAEAPKSVAQTEKPIEADEISDGPKEAEPKVIVETERGFAHYVGIAFLTVLAVLFFFIPGIALVFAVSCIATITAPVAWIFSAILSIIIWIIFKSKIKGFKSSMIWYLGFSFIIFAIFLSLIFGTSYHITSGLITLLTGSN
ncbi:MAG: hypothetical protein WCR04_12315 [Fibrobacteraceae bacterium]